MEEPSSRYYTSGDWVNRKPLDLGDWPQRKKKQGDISRVKSGQTASVRAMLRRVEKTMMKGRQPGSSLQ